MIWVDTDFGFDDLWALLLLRQLGVRVAGISLVAGNAPLARVAANALGAARAYGLEAPIWRGADRPLKGRPETAERILGPRGMQSRGRHLPEIADRTVPDGAMTALQRWLLDDAGDGSRTVLALGPLTNLAALVKQAPDAAQRITRLVWMGGSTGPGNHTPAAEFNALADPHAAAVVADAGFPLDVVDLTLCRQVRFGPADLPDSDPLTADLLGGYLDIGLVRGRPDMSIYDPVAALAAVRPALFTFEPRRLEVCTEPGETYGATRFHNSSDGRTRLAVRRRSDVARICMNTLAREDCHAT